MFFFSRIIWHFLGTAKEKQIEDYRGKMGGKETVKVVD